MNYSTLRYIVLYAVVGMCCLLLLNSCKRNRIVSNSNDHQTVIATLYGQVLTEDGKPIKDAVVLVGENTYFTDSSGIFYFSKVQTSLNATLISVTKANYFTGYRTLRITPNKEHYTRIMLIEKKNAEQFNAGSGGTIYINGGGLITFSSNSIVDRYGAPYTGVVNVYSKWLDPTGNEMFQLMPGDLRGQDSSNEEKLLQTFGMIGVELFDNNNQPLQIAKSKTAQISFPIPVAMAMNAPAEIPLWYFNSSTGLWRQEGSAIKQGSNYVGDVKHFTFWNCDWPGNFVNLDCTFKDGKGIPFADAEVRMTDKLTGASFAGYTNSSGYVSGLVPANAVLTLEVRMQSCINYFYSQTVTTLNTPISLGTISVVLPSVNSVTISGTLFNCIGNPVVNGFANIDGCFFTTDSSGRFNATLALCNLPKPVTVIVYDMNEKVSGTSNAMLDSGTNDLGMLFACGSPLGYIEWTSTVGIASTTFLLHEPLDYLHCVYVTPPSAYTRIEAQNSSFNIFFPFDGADTPGNHNLLVFHDHLDTDTLVTSVPIIISSYGPPGGFIEGYFAGNFQGSTIPSRTISCKFRVRRN